MVLPAENWHGKISFMKNRIGYYDIAKGIGIILVVVAHIEYMPLELRQYIVTFHMPAFFVISGMLMRLTNEKERDIKALLSHKLKRILLPYFVFSLIFPITYYLRFLVTGEGYSNEHFIQDILVGISMTGVSVLWFLPALFFSELIVLFIIKNLKKPYILILIALMIVGICYLPFLVHFMALFLWRIVYCSALVMIGYLLFPVIEIISKKPVAAFFIAVILFTILYFTGMINGIVDLHYVITGNKLLYYLNATMGSAALIFLSVFIDSKLKRAGNVLEFYGRHSLFVMITHIDFMILFFAEKMAFFFSDISPRGKEIIFNISAVIMTLVIEAVLIIIWEKAKKYGILFISDRKKAKSNVLLGKD